MEIVLLHLKEGDRLRWRIFLCCILGYSVPKPQARLFPQLSWKSRGKRALSKNFSVILSVCWFTRENGESLHPILLDSFSILISVISMQSDKWKIFGWRLFLSSFTWRRGTACGGGFDYSNLANEKILVGVFFIELLFIIFIFYLFNYAKPWKKL